MKNIRIQPTDTGSVSFLNHISQPRVPASRFLWQEVMSLPPLKGPPTPPSGEQMAIITSVGFRPSLAAAFASLFPVVLLVRICQRALQPTSSGTAVTGSEVLVRKILMLDDLKPKRVTAGIRLMSHKHTRGSHLV